MPHQGTLPARSSSNPGGRLRLVALLVAVLVAALTVALPANPAQAAYVGTGGSPGPGELWVDGSNRMMSAWLIYESFSAPGALYVARHRAGTDQLDATFGEGGIKTHPLSLPSGTFPFSLTFVDMGYTSVDGALVVVWLRAPSDSHSDDRFVFDRYDPDTGALRSRAEVPAPLNSWCDDGHDSDDDTGEICDAEEGEGNRTPQVEVLDTASPAVAVNVFARMDYDSGVANGTYFFNPTGGGVRYRLTTTPEPSGWFAAMYGVNGVVVNTTGGTAYRVSGWSQATGFPQPSGCRYWGGRSTRFVRTCREGGGTRITVLETTVEATGLWAWEQIIAWNIAPITVTELPDGKVGMVVLGCVTADPCTGRAVAVRATANTVERSDMGPTGMPALVDPVSLGSDLPIGVLKLYGSINSSTNGVEAMLAYRTPNPLADAGLEQRVNTGAMTTLDGSKSSDPGGQPITYAWEQIGGPLVVLSDPRSVRPTFKAPGAATDLRFRLTVTDTTGLTGTDEVIVKVVAPK